MLRSRQGGSIDWRSSLSTYHVTRSAIGNSRVLLCTYVKFLAIVRMSFLFGLKLGFVTHHHDTMLCDLTDVEMSLAG